MAEETKQGKKFELTMEMRMLLAFLLMGAVFLLTPLITGRLQKPEPKQASPKQAQTTQPATSTPAAAARTPAASAPKAVVGGVPVTAAAKAEDYVVETDVDRVVFSNQGGVVKSWQLKKYKDTNGKPVELVSEAAVPKAGWPMAFVFKDNAPKTDLNQALFVRKDSGDPLAIEFEYSDGAVVARKSFRFRKDMYRVQVASEVTEGGQTKPHLLAWRGGFGDRTIHNSASTQHSVYYDAANSKLVVQEAKAAKDGPVLSSGQFSFGGIEDGYFAGVFLPAAGMTLDVQTWSDSFVPPGEKDEVAHVGAAVGGGTGTNSRCLSGRRTWIR